jgi:predicted nuclease of predicted toxin-antitoxin system
MKLLIDMNLSPRWVNLLADAGIDATHWSMLGAANALDVEIAAFAARNKPC